MSNSNRVAILELFDFNKKKVLCLFIDREYIQGLIIRGAEVWFMDSEKDQIKKLQIEFNNEKNIKFINNNTVSNFDYSIATDLKYKNKGLKESATAKENIIIVAGMIKVIKLLLQIKSSFNKQDGDIYSITPSLNNIKLIIPEQLDLSIERYWSLKSLNPFISIKLIIEWFCIKNNLIRKIFADKLIVFK